MCSCEKETLKRDQCIERLRERDMGGGVRGDKE